jgi:hypothetical protein
MLIKQNTQNRGRKKDKMDRPKSMQKEKTTNESGSQMENEQIKHSNLPSLQGAYQIKSGEKHLKKHLA